MKISRIIETSAFEDVQKGEAPGKGNVLEVFKTSKSSLCFKLLFKTFKVVELCSCPPCEKIPFAFFLKKTKGEKEESEKERKCTNRHLYTTKSNSLGPYFALGEKRKKSLATFPSPDYRWARFARRCFSYLTPFFLFPHCGAWSQARGAKNMK